MNDSAQFLDVLIRNGHVPDSKARMVHLSGGVSSEIYLVEAGNDRFVVKRALPQLKVKDPWFADIGRNRSERDYLACVNEMMPGVVPKVYFSCPDEGYFGMEYLDESYKNWKQLLLARESSQRHAELAGNILGEIHRRTSSDQSLRRKFDTTGNFHQLRTEPYLLTTGARHPALQAVFEAEARRIEAVREALVHGDFSPKNILIKDDRMVLLDCEVAWYGDPVFDVAFLLNHLFLKALHHAHAESGVEGLVDMFWHTYKRECLNDMADKIEHRLIPLLLMLLLARVDGKSPVEYLNAGKREFIRTFVNRHLPMPPRSLAKLRDTWLTAITAADFEETHA
jgi:aminoglycoside phosphotransferase (APT) family kinase protein